MCTNCYPVDSPDMFYNAMASLTWDTSLRVYTDVVKGVKA